MPPTNSFPLTEGEKSANWSYATDQQFPLNWRREVRWLVVCHRPTVSPQLKERSPLTGRMTPTNSFPSPEGEKSADWSYATDQQFPLNWRREVLWLVVCHRPTVSPQLKEISPLTGRMPPTNSFPLPEGDKSADWSYATDQQFPLTWRREVRWLVVCHRPTLSTQLKERSPLTGHMSPTNISP